MVTPPSFRLAVRLSAGSGRGRPIQPHKCKTAFRPPNRPSTETWNLNVDSGGLCLVTHQM
jgi:hypothetical protein